MPTGLHQIYERNWANIQRRPADERRRAMAILRWATFAYRPLKLSELAEALAIYEEDSESLREEGEEDYNDDDMDDDGAPEFPMDELPEEIDEEYVNGEIKDLCGSLIEVRNDMIWGPDTPQGYGTIHLVHISVKEYLHLKFADSGAISSLGKLSPSTASQAMQHGILAKTCLRYLTYSEVWDRGVLPTFDVENGSFLDYAATSFDTHALAAGKNNQLTQRINHFFHKSSNFSRWKNNVGGVGAGPLYHACRLRLLDTVRVSLKEKGEEPNTLAGRFGTALQVACVNGDLPIVELLIDSGADVNLEGGEYGSAVNAAVANGDNRIISYLIDKGAKLDTKSAEGRTAIHLSAKNGDTKLLERLLCHDTDITIADNEGVTPLHLAASSGNSETVKFLLEKGANIAAATSMGRTPLCYACQMGHTDTAKLLVGEGADINHSPSSGNTPVYEASCFDSVETLQYLLSQGAVVTAEGRALQNAAREGFTYIVKLLVNAGVSLEDGVGDRTIYNACISGSHEIVKFLLSKGVGTKDINAPHSLTFSLHQAVWRGHAMIVRLLLAKGAETEVPDPLNDDKLPLQIAAKEGFTEIVKALLQKNAIVEPQGRWELSPLYRAVCLGNVEMVRLLRRAGADPVKYDKYGNTPLLQSVLRGNEIIFKMMMWNTSAQTKFPIPGKYGTLMNAAAYGGDLGIVKLMLQFGVAENVTDIHGRNPAHFAARGGHVEVLKLLLDSGFDPQSTDLAGRGIVHHAACSGSVEALHVALSAQPLNAKASDSLWSPLHWVCKSGGVEAVNLLLEHGVKESTVTTIQKPAAEWTPFRIAVFHQNKELVRRWDQTNSKLGQSIVVKGEHIVSPGGCYWCLHVSSRFLCSTI